MKAKKLIRCKICGELLKKSKLRRHMILEHKEATKKIPEEHEDYLKLVEKADAYDSEAKYLHALRVRLKILKLHINRRYKKVSKTLLMASKIFFKYLKYSKKNYQLFFIL